MRKTTIAYQAGIFCIVIYIAILSYNHYKRKQYKKYKQGDSMSSRTSKYTNNYSDKYTKKSSNKYDEKSSNNSANNSEIISTNDNASNVDPVYPSKNVYSKKMTKLEIRENLGRSTWTLLHTMAAVYPGIPSAQHKKDILTFIQLLSKLYPCGDCAEHFQQLLKDHPPKVNDHDAFAQWMCSAHNVVNKRLGKNTFDCSKVDEVWECGCEGGP